MQSTMGRTVSKILRAYYRGPDHPMKLRWWGWLRRWTNYPRFTIPYGRKGWITVDERDYLQGRIFLDGCYEPEVWEALASLAVADEVVWDVGANVGSVAVRALLDVRIKEVHAFEPDPVHAEILAFNLSMNPSKYKIHRLALSDRIEEKILHHATFPHLGGSTFEIDPTNGTFDGSFTVDCSTADTLVFLKGIPAPTLMKIDVEGWELPVCQGADRLFKERPPKAMVFEASSDPAGEIKTPGLVPFLRERGYQVSWIRRPEGEIYHRENYLAQYAR